MQRKWFDVFSVISIVFIIVVIILYWTNKVPVKISFILTVSAIVLFIIRTILRMYFFMKDRKK
jgi:hypothetical protein